MTASEPDLPAPPDRFLAELRDELGAAAVVVDRDICAAHEVDWTGRMRGAAGAVVRPRDVDQVAVVVALARAHQVALVPQGGNTGLVAGAVPLDGAVVIDLRRLDAVIDADPISGQVTVGAGVTLAALQAQARAMGWEYGVDWAARETATVGGSVATNAGGLRFIRHGGTSAQLLGVEAVLGTEQVVRPLPRVEKDNTGYRLPSLLCGSEGTLGIITAARVRLVAPTPPTATALLGFSGNRDAVEAAHQLRRELPGVEALEFVAGSGMDLVRASFGLGAPFAREAGGYLLIELADDRDPGGRLGDAVQQLPGVLDAAVALDPGRRADLYRYRELQTDAIARVGPADKLDVTLPAPALADFLDAVPALVHSIVPAAQVWLFGHAGDGNVHVNVTGLDPFDERVDGAVFADVAARGGSISAEHGIGRAKRRWLHLAHDPAGIDTMWHIKDALDPDGVMNPGVLLPDRL